MPLNVYGKDGNHLGFLTKSYPEAPGIFLAALTERKIEEFEMNPDKPKLYLAGVYGSKNWRGIIDDDKLFSELEAKYGKHFSDEVELFRYAFIRTAFDRHELHAFRHVDINITDNAARGFILVSLRKAVWDRTRIVLNEEMDYLATEKVCGGLPIYARVTDYPVFHTDIMGSAEGFFTGASWSDYGGRNHAHTTKVTILSGNVTKKIELPVFLHVAKGMAMQIYYNGDQIEKVFCGDAIYDWGPGAIQSTP